MPTLDHKTIERVARLICDIDGPQERRGFEVEALLRGAGWTDVPEYDGTPRIPWLVETLRERLDSPGDIARLLCRICDPVEYDGGVAVAEEVRQALNRILAAEGLEITLISSRPVLSKTNNDGDAPVFGPPDDIESRLKALLPDENVVRLLTDRIAQSRSAQQAGAYLLTVFGIGSFVEGLLYTVLMDRFPELARTGFSGNNGRSVDAKRAGLELLIDTAHDRGLIQLDAKNFMHPVRNFRNYIHPRQQLENSFNPDQDTVALCWGPVHAVLNDLESTHSQGAL